MIAESIVRHAVGDQLAGELAALTERVRAGVVQVRDGRGGGAGTVWSDDGLIVTNHHVVPGERAKVTIESGETFDAHVIASLPERDLAVLRAEGGGEALQPLPVGDSAALRPGELVLAVGHPLGLTGAVSLGVFSGIGPIEGRGGRHFQEALLANIRLLPGNSGGPLVNARGEVVGINSMVLGHRTALAVPSVTVLRLVAAARGEAPRRTLGLTLQLVETPAALAERHGLRQPALLLVAGVAADSPAERAGIIPGDLLVSIDGQPLEEPGDLAWALTGRANDAAVTLGLLHGGEVHEAVV